MALLWSKKPKAEKNFTEENRKASVAQKGVEPKKAKAAPATAKAAAKTPKAAGKNAVAAPAGRFDETASAIIRPHITEKSGILSQSGVYTFEVASSANKASVAKAVKSLYKVSPVSVNMINMPSKQIFVKGRWGNVSAMKKALVTVKKGDKIDFV